MTERKFDEITDLKKHIDQLRFELEQLMQLRKKDFKEFVQLRILFMDSTEMYFRNINLYELFNNLIKNIPILKREYESLFQKFLNY